MSKRITEKNQAFTMVELLAVLVILGIIMAITIPVVSHYISGNNKDYYEKLEATVVSSGQDFFNDYHANLPKEIGQVSKVDVNTLTDQKYITEILGTDKKSCEGSVITQKLANGKYSYTACLKCDKQSDGSYKYESSNRECGYNPDNNSKYVIKIDGLGENTTTQTAQAQSYTVPSAHVYVNDQPLAIELKPTPSSINTDILGINKIYYTYKSEVKELSVRVYDPKKPELANITATANGVNIGSGVYTANDVSIKLSSTDWTTATVYGSGINYFEYQLNGGTKEQLTPTTTDNKTFTLTKTFTSTGIYNISVKAVDKEGNVSDAKTFVVKIDKAKPTGTITVARNGGSYNSLNVKATLSSTDNTGGSGVKQMCVQESSDVTKCSWVNYATSKTLTLSGSLDGKARTVYAWFKDAVGNVSTAYSAKYTPYTECSSVNLSANWSTCTKTCDGGTQTKTATDKYTGKACPSKN